MANKLTPKQEAFVLAYLQTGNANEAYRRAYDAGGMTPQSVEKEAKRLLKHPLVTPRLERISQRAEVKALLSLEDHMDELRGLRDLAKQNGQVSAAIAAEVKRGELRRFYVKQVENGGPGEFDNMSDDELRDFIAGGADTPRAGKESASAARGSRRTRSVTH